MLEISSTYGHYLKVIYDLSLDRSPVATSTIAKRMRVSNASVSDMLRKLNKDHYVNHVPYRGAELTEKGKKQALKLLRRHRLWELFLVKFMKLPWESVHMQADRLEHATDDLLEERLSELLGNPEYDPHGDPIPTKEGNIDEPPRLRLSEMKKGDSAQILQCIDESPALLKHLRKINLLPGVSFKLLEIQPFDGSYILSTQGKEIYISPTIAELLIVHSE